MHICVETASFRKSPEMNAPKCPRWCEVGEWGIMGKRLLSSCHRGSAAPKPCVRKVALPLNDCKGAILSSTTQSPRTAVDILYLNCFNRMSTLTRTASRFWWMIRFWHECGFPPTRKTCMQGNEAT